MAAEAGGEDPERRVVLHNEAVKVARGTRETPLRAIPVTGPEAIRRKRILFVDDQAQVLQGLARTFRSMRAAWDMQFASNGSEALARLGEVPIDVLVTDMRMPGMTGAELLERVKESHPAVVRIILSGYADQKAILESTCVAHQYLSKPCDATVLKDAIARSCALRDLLTDGILAEHVASLGSLPGVPSTYAAIQEELRAEEPSLERVADVVGADVAMTAKILHLVNSAFFGLAREVVSPAQAVSVLGLETLKGLVLSVGIFSLFDPQRCAGFSVDHLWEESLAAGDLSRRIAATMTENTRTQDTAYLAGLLHDVGKLVLAERLPVRYAQVLAAAASEGIPAWRAELREFGFTHAQIGGSLLSLWSINEGVVEAVSFHHRPSSCPTRAFHALTAVHVADILLSAACGSGSDATKSLAELDRSHIAAVNVAGRLTEWARLTARRRP